MNLDRELKSIRKHIPYIFTVCDRYHLDKKIMLGIAIIENINRPWWIRKLEKLSNNRTYGLMQVKSINPLTDEQSIIIAAKKISKIKQLDVIEIGKLFNGCNDYGVCLKYIVDELENKKIKINF